MALGTRMGNSSNRTQKHVHDLIFRFYNSDLFDTLVCLPVLVCIDFPNLGEITTIYFYGYSIILLPAESP